MTMWRAGMLAVCVQPKDGWWIQRRLNLWERIKFWKKPGPDYGELVRIIAVSELGLMLDKYRKVGGSNAYYEARFFRPLVDQEDDLELIARIKNCKPARTPTPTAADPGEVNA